ncbi:TonB-dependent receptor [Polaribacter sp. HL-MS24]|uniref:SusC/RagA family TonB-linked outer membrane protein n=1 Tax=Polaribacter sp. HL-MS24 TaxID=3077735 RepID=UPI0029348EF1|nr:TonB-dependent receptor [Polaribacter sp. HL-MS24]WOC40886.1 TonB-dependent receptor [Polaribacter sp. HL-MS24]
MKIKILLMLFFTFSMQSVSAQKQFNGTVSSNDGSFLLGATIVVKGTQKGVETDFDGKFSITAKVGDVLIISYVGYKSKEVVLTTFSNYAIILEEGINQLDEIVVIGYGTQKKAILTSSVTQVKGEDLAKEPVVNAIQALQGKAAGVQIIASDAPGRASTIVIRGLGTVQGGRSPIYVVDGLITDNIDNINSSDIKSMNVLKDAASLAIYGNKGANGVIVVTTKKGHEGKMKITYDNYTGFRDILSRVEMANASEYVIYTNEAILRSLSNDNDVSSFLPTNQPYNTDWLDVITRIGRVSNHNLSLSGGTENLQSFFSAGLYEEEGILKDSDFNRLTLRSNLNYKINDKLDFSHNINVQLSSSSPTIDSRFTTAYKQAPIIPVRDDQGRYGSSKAINNVGNPAIIEFNEQQEKRFRLQGAFKLDYKLLEPLTFTSRFTIESEYDRFRDFRNRLGSYLASNPDNTEAKFEGGIDNPAKTRLTMSNFNSYRWFVDNYVTINKTFNEVHNINATLGITAEERGGEFLSGTRNNVPIDRNLRFNLGTGDLDTTQKSDGNLNVQHRLYSYIARVNYDYKDKYLLNASFRRDASSKFQAGSRSGDFFAVSTGWVVTEEDFMQDGLFDVLKLRASYGELGNDNVRFNVLTATTGAGGFYPFGSGQNVQQGITISGAVQEDLTWEVTNELNLGVEFTLLDRKLSGEIDYYKRVNTNATLEIQLPDVVGYLPFNSHVGEIQNKGVEGSLYWSDAISDEFKYHIGGNFSYNKNELTKVLNPFFNEQTGGNIDNGQYTKRVAVGQPLGSFFLYDIEGIDDRGEFVYKDVNNDGTIDETDRQFFGSYFPKYFFGINLGFEYKNFDFNVDTFGNFGNKVYNGKKAQRFSGENIERSTFNNRWTSGRASNTGPIAFNAVPLSSTYYLESGDFLRINNITLGYTLPQNISKYFSKIRIYASAKNPFIFKKFSGFTPELAGSGNGDPLGTAGIELDAYPTLKSFYAGLNLSF